MILEYLGQRNVSTVLDVLAVLFGLSLLWAMVKASYQRVTGHAMPKNSLTVSLDVLADLANNLPGAANRILTATGGTSMFWKTERAKEAENAKK